MLSLSSSHSSTSGQPLILSRQTPPSAAQNHQPLWKRIVAFIATVLFHIITFGIVLLFRLCQKKTPVPSTQESPLNTLPEFSLLKETKELPYFIKKEPSASSNPLTNFFPKTFNRLRNCFPCCKKPVVPKEPLPPVKPPLPKTSIAQPIDVSRRPSLEDKKIAVKPTIPPTPTLTEPITPPQPATLPTPKKKPRSRRSSLSAMVRKEALKEVPLKARSLLFQNTINPEFLNSYPMPFLKFLEESAILTDPLSFKKKDSLTFFTEERTSKKSFEAIHHLDSQYFAVKTVPDGTCFYRAYAIGWLVSLFRNESPKSFYEESQKILSLPFAKSSEEAASLTEDVAAILTSCDKISSLEKLFDEVFYSSTMHVILLYLQQLSCYSAKTLRAQSFSEASAKAILLLQLQDSMETAKNAITLFPLFKESRVLIQNLFWNPKSFLASAPLDDLTIFLLCSRSIDILLDSQQENVVRHLGLSLNKILAPHEDALLEEFAASLEPITRLPSFHEFITRTPYLEDVSKLFLFLESRKPLELPIEHKLFVSRIKEIIRKETKSTQLSVSIFNKVTFDPQKVLAYLLSKDLSLKVVHTLLTTISFRSLYSLTTSSLVRDVVLEVSDYFLRLPQSERNNIISLYHKLKDALVLNTPLRERYLQFMQYFTSTPSQKSNIVLDYLFFINLHDTSISEMLLPGEPSFLEHFSPIFERALSELNKNTTFASHALNTGYFLISQKLSSNLLERITAAKENLSSAEFSQKNLIESALRNPEFFFSIGATSFLQNLWDLFSETEEEADNLIKLLTTNTYWKPLIQNHRKVLVDTSRGDIVNLDTKDIQACNVTHAIPQSAFLYSFLLHYSDELSEDTSDLGNQLKNFKTTCSIIAQTVIETQTKTLFLVDTSLMNSIEQKILRHESISTTFFDRVFFSEEEGSPLSQLLLSAISYEMLDSLFSQTLNQAETEHVSAILSNFGPFSILQYSDQSEEPTISCIHAPKGTSPIVLFHAYNHYGTLLVKDSEAVEEESSRDMPVEQEGRSQTDSKERSAKPSQT